MAISLGSSSISNLKLGSTQVKGVYQGSDLVWPSVLSPVIYTEVSPDDATLLQDYNLSVGSGANAEVQQDFRFRKSGNSVIFEVKGSLLPVGGGFDENDFYLLTGTSSLTSSYQKILELEIVGGIDAVKLDWNLIVDTHNDDPSDREATSFINGQTTAVSATYAAADNTWQTLADGESIGMRYNAEANVIAATGPDLVAEEATHATVGVWVRKTGFDDTLLATFVFRNNVKATSSRL